VRTLPSRRTIAIVLVGGVAIAALAPPGAALWIAGLGVLGWAASRADALAARETFRVDRRVPERAPQGEWFDLRWRVRARGRDLRGLVVGERLPDTFDAEGREASFRVPAGGNARATGRLRGRRRGVWTIGPGAGRVLGPRGLGWLRVDPAPAREIRVDPAVDPLRRLSLDTQRTRWQGEQTRRLRGVGSEFESFRDYRPDDDFRWIDWKASARRRRRACRGRGCPWRWNLTERRRDRAGAFRLAGIGIVLAERIESDVLEQHFPVSIVNAADEDRGNPASATCIDRIGARQLEQ